MPGLGGFGPLTINQASLASVMASKRWVRCFSPWSTREVKLPARAISCYAADPIGRCKKLSIHQVNEADPKLLVYCGYSRNQSSLLIISRYCSHSRYACQNIKKGHIFVGGGGGGGWTAVYILSFQNL